jgi:AcrR family transcriptional regulator
MARAALPTRDRILQAAHRLFYSEGIRAVSLDAIAGRARVTKKTIYYHFRSKDDLIESYVASRDEPNIAYYRARFDEAEGDVAAKITAIFEDIGRLAAKPRWRGCGFQRAAAELADVPGHPALKRGAAHKARLETWLADSLAETYPGTSAALLARQIAILLDGLFATMLVHRDTGYADAAAAAAVTLLRNAERSGAA